MFMSAKEKRLKKESVNAMNLSWRSSKMNRTSSLKASVEILSALKQRSARSSLSSMPRLRISSEISNASLKKLDVRCKRRPIVRFFNLSVKKNENMKRSLLNSSMRSKWKIKLVALCLVSKF